MIKKDKKVTLLNRVTFLSGKDIIKKETLQNRKANLSENGESDNESLYVN